MSAFLDNAPTYLSFLSAIGGGIDANAINEVQSAMKAPSNDGGTAVSSAVISAKQYFPSQFASGTMSVDQIKTAVILGDKKLSSLLVAISIAAVFFGAATYIGNGPNFMVKSIAHHQKVHSPIFIGYIVKYTLPFLLPTLVIIWLIFFRN